MRIISSRPTVFFVISPSSTPSSSYPEACPEGVLPGASWWRGFTRFRKSTFELVVQLIAVLMPLVARLLIPFQDVIFASLFFASRTSSCHLRCTMRIFDSFSPSLGGVKGGGGGV